MVLGWGARPRGDAGHEVEHVLPTKVLGRFVEAMRLRDAPTIVDLGAVVGSNVTFLAERLGCRLTVVDLFVDLERLARAGQLARLAEAFRERFPQDDASVDGIICWDLFDYIDKPSAAVLGAELVRLMRPGGALLAFFSSEKTQASPQFTRFVIKDDTTLLHRQQPGSCSKVSVLTYRDIELTFPGLKVSDSFLLLNHTREMLFRR